MNTNFDKNNRKDFGGGFFNDLITKIRLTIALVQDDRISMLVRAIPVFCLIYLIVPIDLLIGPIDDALVLYFGIDYFISACPRDIVDEHLAAIRGGKSSSEQKEDIIIDAEFKDKE